jgi:hypothetical protein
MMRDHLYPHPWAFLNQFAARPDTGSVWANAWGHGPWIAPRDRLNWPDPMFFGNPENLSTRIPLE